MLEHREIHAPYPGLRPFESHETPIFFGREAHVSRLLEILQRERFLAVIGTSGSGKSSLIRAGMLPALAAGWTGDVSDWRIAEMRPGDRPMRRLAEALLEPEALGLELIATESDADQSAEREATSMAPLIEAELGRGPRGLIALVEDARRNAGERSFNLLVLVDQFEEIFRYAETGIPQGNEAEAFVNAILQPRLETFDAARRIYVALTMRTDALHECARFLELPEAINGAQYLTPRLKPEELRRTITEPARVFEGAVEPDVVTTLVNSVIDKPDQLPILQHALSRMWETANSRDTRNPSIKADDITQTGGIENALSNHANTVFNALSPLEQMYADVLFRAVTTTLEGVRGDARRPQRVCDIARFAGLRPEQWEVLVPIVRAFGREGVNFLTFREPIDGNTVIDISHEALIRQWDRLRTLVALEAEQAAPYMRWRDRADQWQDGGELLGGADLAAARRWRHGTPQGSALDNDAALSRAMVLASPTANWAERYAKSRNQDEARAEFYRVLKFIARSEQREDARINAEVEAEHERRAAHERAAAAELARERDRLEAAKREQAMAEAAATKSRRFAAISLGVAAIAVLAAILAVHFWTRAQDSLIHSTAVRLAAEGQAMVATARPGGTLRGALQVLAAHRIQPGVEPYFALQSTTGRLNRLVRLMETASPVLSVAFTPDGKRIVSASADNTLRLWDSETGAPVGEPLRGHLHYVSSVAFSPDGRRIVSGDDNTLRLWDVEKGTALGEPLRGHTTLVSSVAFSPDGKRIVSGSWDNTLRLWDAEKGVALGEPLRGHDRAVRSVAFSPDGKRIVSGSDDNTLRLWDAEKGVALGEPLRSHAHYVSSVAFSPDGKRIVSGSDDNTLRLWDAEKRVALGEPLGGHTDRVKNVAFSPDGKRIVSASGDNTLRLWDSETGVPLGEPLRGHLHSVSSVAFSPDGKRIVSGSDDKTLRLWNVETEVGLVEALRGHTGSVLSVAFSPDGKRIVSGSWDNTLQLWDAEKGGALGEPLRGHTHRVTSVAFSPDGKSIVSASGDNTLRLWDSETGVPLGEPLRGHLHSVSSVAFSPDGKRIVSGSYDKTLRLWDVEKGTAFGEPLRGHTTSVSSVAFSPDGKRIVSGSLDTPRLWGAEKGVVLGELRGHTGSVWSVAFSPDGKRIVSGSSDNTLRLWDAEKGTPLGEPLRGHIHWAKTVAFSPDGKRVVSGSEDATLRLWDAEKGVALGEPLRGGSVSSVAFSPDGKRIVSGSFDNTLRIWPVLDAWADILCAKLPRNMTHAEWKSWVGDLPYQTQCPNLPEPRT